VGKTLLEQIFGEIDDLEEEMSGEDAVAWALERALKFTTPDRPGCPWDDDDGSTTE
jgi:hypothetical protein